MDDLKRKLEKEEMTNEQAIAILRRIQEPDVWEPRISQAGFEAIEMAVNALKGDPIDRNKLTNDLILILHDDVCAPKGHLDPYYVFDVIKKQPNAWEVK